MKSLESSGHKVLDLAAWRGSFVVSMQMACSAQLTYSPSLLSEKAFVFWWRRCSLWAVWMCGQLRAQLRGSGFSMRRWLVLLWEINGTVINLASHRNTSTIYSHSYSCVAAKCLIILNVFLCGMWLLWDGNVTVFCFMGYIGCFTVVVLVVL